MPPASCPSSTIPEPASRERSTTARCFRSSLLVTALTVLALAPFLNKAVHLDDYLFLRAARQIIEHPTDPYGTTVNWYGLDMPLAEVTQNPPGACYYLAATAKTAGWSEIALHAAFLLPAVLAALGILALARRFCPHPLVATLVALATPAFWVSATSLMCDVPMLALWVWAVECWLRGLEERSNRWLATAAALAGAAALTKYFGLALIPLLLAYTALRNGRPSWSMLWLLVPLFMVLAYDRLAAWRYGHGLLAAAGEYASTRDKPGTLWQRGLTTLSFTGGCLLPVLVLTPWFRSRWRALSLAVVAIGLGALLAHTETLGTFALRDGTALHWGAIVQISLFATLGLAILLAACEELRHDRSAEALLLLLWIAGTLVFTGILNWTINGRSLLPLVPAAAILLVRQLARHHPWTGTRSAVRTLWPAIPAAGLAAAVVWADAAFADNSRAAARIVHERLAGQPGSIWFQGHWGFQYYMEAGGARPLDQNRPQMRAGDYLISPDTNTNIAKVPDPPIETFGKIEIGPAGWISTMHMPSGVGFYSDSWGPLPFGFTGGQTQVFSVARMRTLPSYW